MKVQKINNINKQINFKQNNTNSLNAGLMIQSKNGNLNFARDKYITQQANSIDSNPITSLGYKLYKTFGYFRNQEANQAPKALNVKA